MTMKNRVPMQSVVVMRDNERVYPEIGKVFAFTAEEVQQIEKANPDAISSQATVEAEKVETPKAPAKKSADKKTEGGDL